MTLKPAFDDGSDGQLRPLQISALNRERNSFLALASIKGVGYQTLWRIAEARAAFSDILWLDDGDAAAAELRRFGAKIEARSVNSWSEVREQALERAGRIMGQLEAAGIALVMRGEISFPPTLNTLKNPPHWLFVEGSVSVLSERSISVVGTREPSADGLWLSTFVGHCLHEWRCPTVSGLALGIDQSIHGLSIRAGVPTIAVLGTGIFLDLSKNVQNLRREIVASGGAVITEYLPRESYSARHFVHRNRIQAALGRVLIPVEWSPKSGTAHTVRFAASLQRPIAALRLPDWPTGRVTLSNGLGERTGRIFTVPGEETEFRGFVRQGLETASPFLIEGKSPQLSFFGR